MKAAIVVNMRKKGVESALRRTKKALDKHRFEYDVFAKYHDPADVILPLSKLPRYDLIVTLGGDGTLLRACRTVNIHKTPIIGVNLGTLGFITDIRPAVIEKTIDQIIKKKQYMQKRILMEVRVWKEKKLLANMTALNDLVISNETVRRMLTLQWLIDGYKVNECNSDGMIIATPTGSTGHAMSAGGPIVYPELSNLIIMPICPHSLTNRPLLVSGTRKITVQLARESRGEAALSVDGQRYISIDQTCRVEIAVSRHYILLAAFDKNSYWDMLRSKLGWRGSIKTQ